MTVTLTGKQNSSKAGLTNVVYWLRICSRSLPRFMSRRTTETNLVTLLTGCCNIWSIVCGKYWNDLCETVWRLNLCRQRASCGTFPALSVCRRPESPQRGPHPLGTPWSCLPTWEQAHEFNTEATFHENMELWRKTPEMFHGYLEWVMKSYVGTSTTLPSTMSFKVLYINSLSNASAS